MFDIHRLRRAVMCSYVSPNCLRSTASTQALFSCLPYWRLHSSYYNYYYYYYYLQFVRLTRVIRIPIVVYFCNKHLCGSYSLVYLTGNCLVWESLVRSIWHCRLPSCLLSHCSYLCSLRACERFVVRKSTAVCSLSEERNVWPPKAWAIRLLNLNYLLCLT